MNQKFLNLTSYSNFQRSNVVTSLKMNRMLNKQQSKIGFEKKASFESYSTKILLRTAQNYFLKFLWCHHYLRPPPVFIGEVLRMKRCWPKGTSQISIFRVSFACRIINIGVSVVTVASLPGLSIVGNSGGEGGIYIRFDFSNIAGIFVKRKVDMLT